MSKTRAAVAAVTCKINWGIWVLFPLPVSPAITTMFSDLIFCKTMSFCLDTGRVRRVSASPWYCREFCLFWNVCLICPPSKFLLISWPRVIFVCLMLTSCHRKQNLNAGFIQLILSNLDTTKDIKDFEKLQKLAKIDIFLPPNTEQEYHICKKKKIVLIFQLLTCLYGVNWSILWKNEWYWLTRHWQCFIHTVARRIFAEHYSLYSLYLMWSLEIGQPNQCSSVS